MNNLLCVLGNVCSEMMCVCVRFLYIQFLDVIYSVTFRISFAGVRDKLEEKCFKQLFLKDVHLF